MKPDADGKEVTTRRRPRGRPRAQGADERIRAAARQVVAAKGYAETSLDEIANAAGVSRGSVYRRWPSKALLVYDACLAPHGPHYGVEDSGDIAADLLAIGRATGDAFRSGQSDLVEMVLADAARSTETAELLRTDFFKPRSDAIVRRVQLAVERGEMELQIDAALVPALVNGAQIYMLRIQGRTLTDDELRSVIHLVVGQR